MNDRVGRIVSGLLSRDEEAKQEGRRAGLVEAATLVCRHCALAHGVQPQDGQTLQELTGTRDRDKPAPGPPQRIGTWRYPYRHRAIVGEREWPCEASKIWDRISWSGIDGGVR